MANLEVPGIEFVHILQKDWIKFKELDPLDRLELLALPGASAIGAVDVSGEEAFDVGLMVVLKDHDSYVLEWLGIDQQYRDREIGGALLKMLFDLAAENGNEKVYVRLTSEEEDGVSDYFWDHFFEEEIEQPDMFRVKVTDFFKKAKMINAGDESGCIPLKELDDEKKNRLLEYIRGCEEGYSMFEGWMNWDLMDGELSSISYGKNGEIDGVFLCMTLGINCYPILLAADEPLIEQKLVGHAINKLHSMEKRGYMLSVLCSSRDMSEMAEDILKGEGRIKQKLMAADVDRYCRYRDAQ
ncbi:MAG: hypothetical protein J6N76_05640 [Lachnospiraceae bacterium]|nr:hypothetical protein [Lachnospiraceae bacterium]